MRFKLRQFVDTPQRRGHGHGIHPGRERLLHHRQRRFTQMLQEKGILIQ